MEKHFVTFYSPGSFVAEETTRAIESWDSDLAIAMARGIVERYNARPYGFQFSTRERQESDFDSRETARSGIYYLGGEILTLADVEAKGEPYAILASNMKGNGWERVIENRNSWRWTQPLLAQDVVLDVTL